MTFSFEINQGDWELPASFMDELRIVAQDAMAVRLSDIVLNNFGEDGENRPQDWLPLTHRYAKKYHDGDTTPTLVLSGELRGSINVELGNPEYAAVFTDNPYAAEHQYGNPDKNLPPRPFFPITKDGDLTPYAEEQLVEAAERAIADKLA